MSVKLLAAAVVLLVGFALASLFPNREPGRENLPAPSGVALRRDAPGSDRSLAQVPPRTHSLPPLEAPATAQSNMHPIRVAPSSSAENPFCSPPPMPFDYAAVADKAAPQPAPAAPRLQSSTVRRQATSEPPRVIAHRIVDGDTLSKLADRYLGDAALADRIRQANADRLPENPNWLPIGIELRIPSRVRAETIDAATVASTPGAETRLVPIEPAPVVADTHSR
jgi:hypothetical protein